MAERKRRRSCHVELDEIGCDRICMKHWPTALSVGSGRHFSYFLTRPITNRRITAPMYLWPGGLGIEQYVRDAAWYRSVATVSSTACTTSRERAISTVLLTAFEIVRVEAVASFPSRVHSIRARAHLAQSEPKMARDRFGFLERHRSTARRH